MARVVFAGGRVFDGTVALPSADITVDGERIVDVSPGLDADERVDLSGMTVLPGFFDCHVHLAFDPTSLDLVTLLETPLSYWFYVAERNMRSTLDVGITTVRDAGYLDLGAKMALQAGLIRGPRVQIAVGMLSQTGGHGDDWMVSGINATRPSYPGFPNGPVDGPDEGRRRVRELVRAGADVIKVFTSGGVLSPRDDPRHGHFSDVELAALMDEATRAGRFVMAHAQGAPGIKAAVKAGIRSIEHGIFLDEEAIDLMLERGTWFVPTLIAPQGVLDAVAAGARIPEAMVRKAREVVDIHKAAFRQAVEAGVRIAMGTDSGVTPHGENLHELALMRDGGMEPVAVLEATTRSAAELMGLADELGTLEAGKRADFVVVEGDPFDFADLRSRIRAVYQDGALVAGGL